MGAYDAKARINITSYAGAFSMRHSHFRIRYLRVFHVRICERMRCDARISVYIMQMRAYASISAHAMRMHTFRRLRIHTRPC